MTRRTPPTTQILDAGLWAAQITLAGLLLGLGSTRLGATPFELLDAGMPWAARQTPALVSAVGLLEVLGAIGLVVPAALRVAPSITPLAAAGLAGLMALAGLDMTLNGEWSTLLPVAYLGLLSAFVAWGRGKALPLPPRRLGRPARTMAPR